MILALLGLVNSEKTSPLYLDRAGIGIKEGKYINSIEVLLRNFPDERFILLGTEAAINSHREVPAFQELFQQRKVEFLEFDPFNLNRVFFEVLKKIEEGAQAEEQILFDITHSYRDAVIMGVIATLTSQMIYTPKIKLIYAQELESKAKYQYLEYTYLLDSYNLATTLSIFLRTLRTPPLTTEVGLQPLLEQLSTHLLSNQLKQLYQEDIPKIRQLLVDSKEELQFLGPLVEQLEQFLDQLEKIKGEVSYRRLLLFGKLFWEKGLYLNASTFLIEGFDEFITTLFAPYLVEGLSPHQKREAAKGILNGSVDRKLFNPPHPYFLDLNYPTLERLRELRSRIGDYRHKLVHIELAAQPIDVRTGLKELIEELETVFNSNLEEILQCQQLTEECDRKKKKTLIYWIELLERELQKCAPNQSAISVRNFLKKRGEEELENLNGQNIQCLKEVWNSPWVQLVREKWSKREKFLPEEVVEKLETLYSGRNSSRFF